jgi:hypothetical protein
MIEQDLKPLGKVKPPRYRASDLWREFIKEVKEELGKHKNTLECRGYNNL